MAADQDRPVCGVLWHCLTHDVPCDEMLHAAYRHRALAAVTAPAA